MRRFAVVVAVLLALASCSEHFPRALGEGSSAPVDAAAPTVTDGAAEGGASDADASTVDPGSADAAADPDADAAGPILRDGGDCNVRVASPALVDSPHVATGTAVAYASNPPSSGPHYPVWANFQEFSVVVPDGNLVHSMEHGGVLLFYNCDPAEPACQKVVADLRAVRAAIATDPTCDPGIRVRLILARRPESDTVVAAAAWGQTYRADCVDVPSLTQWVTEHYAKAPEDICAAGQIAF